MWFCPTSDIFRRSSSRARWVRALRLTRDLSRATVTIVLLLGRQRGRRKPEASTFGPPFRIREILALYVECKPRDVTFETNEFGKPFLRNARGKAALMFNVSHSEDLMVL